MPNLETSFRYVFIPALEKKGYVVKNVFDRNRKRHKLVETTNNKKFYVLFKREFFYTYSQQFPEEHCLGESINYEYLLYCVDNNIDFIILVYDDGKIYYITPKDWYQYAKEHNTIRNVEKKDIVRDYGKLKVVEETTVSIPITELKRF